MPVGMSISARLSAMRTVTVHERTYLDNPTPDLRQSFLQILMIYKAKAGQRAFLSWVGRSIFTCGFAVRIEALLKGLSFYLVGFSQHRVELVLEEEPLLREGRFQIVEPCRFLVIPCEKRSGDPVRVSSL